VVQLILTNVVELNQQKKNKQTNQRAKCPANHKNKRAIKNIYYVHQKTTQKKRRRKEREREKEERHWEEITRG